MDNHLDDVLHVKGQLTKLAQPSPHHIVLGALPGGDVEEGLHHLELSGDEHQIVLHIHLELCLHINGRLDTAQRPLHRRPGQPKHETIRHGVVLDLRKLYLFGLHCIKLQRRIPGFRLWRLVRGSQHFLQLAAFRGILNLALKP
ncbi:hypothetical protein PAHAL_3G163500 [Panicum hallii]|uniref:Uncharacterized protein n=1 Tax=Panicum hallii TaxID=206008 RepID=A0A2T8KIE1_9POAL|nr:hypothetical protein PAHAL_3G163500 [Panicum hallii]